MSKPELTCNIVSFCLTLEYPFPVPQNLKCYEGMPSLYALPLIAQEGIEKECINSQAIFILVILGNGKNE